VRVVLGCEFTQTVTKAFRLLGHEAYSLDILPTEGNPDWHIQTDIFADTIAGVPADEFWRSFDIGIFHPSCQYLTVAGNGTWANTPERLAAVDFVKRVWLLPVRAKCIENPIGVLSSLFKKPTQYIHPWQYGHGETKKTCLWLDKLPKLIPTNELPNTPENRVNRIWKMGPSKKYNRSQERSRTYQGWADAMAMQWGGVPTTAKSFRIDCPTTAPLSDGNHR